MTHVNKGPSTVAEFTAASIERQLARLDLSEPSTSSSADWRQNVTAKLRTHLVDKLFEALVAGCRPRNEQTKNCARQLEAEAFVAAKSRTEYEGLVDRRFRQIQSGQRTEQSWRDTVAVELRKQIINKLAQTIIPGCDLEAADEQNSVRNLLEYSQKVEHEIFESATSRSEYYRLMAEKIYNMRREVDEEQMEGCDE